MILVQQPAIMAAGAHVLLRLLLVASHAGSFAHATRNVTLRSIYTDHMVLQHGVAARIVGEASGAAAGVAVSVLLDGKRGSAGSATTAGGGFQVEIEPQAASTAPHTVTISVAGFPPVTLSDILFGDVYLCSGCVAPPWPPTRATPPLKRP